MDTKQAIAAFERYQRRMTWIILGVGAVAAAGLWWQAHPAQWHGGKMANAYLIGLVAGVAALRFVDVPAAIQSVMRTEPKGAARMYFVKMFMNLAIYGVALAVVFLARPYFNPWGALLGMITPKLVLVADSMLRPNLFPSATAPDAPETPPETSAAPRSETASDTPPDTRA